MGADVDLLLLEQDMLAAAKDRVEQEKQWLLSKIGLIPDHDDGKIPPFYSYR